MRNTFGNSISVTVFGESHGEGIGAVIDGLCAGLDVDYERIDAYLNKRRPSGKTDTPRIEKDEYKIISGVFNGKTTGTPIAVIIPNENTKSKDYTYGIARPSHADYTASVKYHGYEDYRGGGHFSGRITASLVVCGAIIITALEKLGIKIGTHILKCAGESDEKFSDDLDTLNEQIATLNALNFPVISKTAEQRMSDKILEASSQGDSVGGVLQTAITGIPAGVGEPFFDSVESVISHALFSVGGVKGVEFGSGFAMADLKGSEANDPFEIVDGKIATKTNNNGGVNGGITNSMPITFNCAIKPTPSISKPQSTVDFVKMENTTLQIKGRHDPAIVRRACVVIESVSALAIADLLAQKYGTDVFLKGF